MAEVGGRRLRADAQRNVDRIVAAAQEVFRRDGAGASLEEIARRAGVGSATLHRHFPGRQVLLEAVFSDRMGALCARADEHAAGLAPGDALVAWLRDFVEYASTSRGLVAALLPEPEDCGRQDGCGGRITSALEGLLRRAQEAGAVRDGVRGDDVLAMVNGISLVTELRGDDGQAERLLELAIDGMRGGR
ncbi:MULTISPECIES: TetR/AcrR family transcriptional regulator [Actinosynnema]|uniref:TetR/AcrR family transcriptional regulator n=1 Tax=Actinosynnema TaxID=40566 RepID=UPI0020A5A02B|nr:TetR/AcrR family transcriptional regulator [Actinosynnema pretiosum]